MIYRMGTESDGEGETAMTKIDTAIAAVRNGALLVNKSDAKGAFATYLRADGIDTRILPRVANALWALGLRQVSKDRYTSVYALA